MKVRELDPSTWKRLGFNFGHLLDAPKLPGCYVIANIYEEILYIGKAASIQQRMKAHIGDPNKQQADNLGASSWFFYKLTLRNETYATEQRLLSAYKFREGLLPPLNILGG